MCDKLWGWVSVKRDWLARSEWVGPTEGIFEFRLEGEVT